jgi:hypothetical protein
MPMPPPKPSTDQGANKRVQREVAQLTRALEDRGPLDRDDLMAAVGGAYWETGRFDRSLTVAADSGRVVKDSEGKYAAT